jgi:putative OPT family oligopeptide transporter
MPPKELTLRGLVLGVLLTTVFTAANVYLGLKVGLTFASSIPAAVISMALLSMVRDSSILENNIVQTVASAAGTLSAIIFVLPGLVIVGWWSGFPFWTSSLICVAGRNSRRAVHDPAATRAGDDVGSAVPGRRGGGGSSESRIRHAR